MSKTRVAGALSVALSLSLAGACGQASSPAQPVSTPIPTPIPTPTPTPTPVSNCIPTPPPVSRWALKVMYRMPDYWILDATPKVGPNVDYCMAVGFPPGTGICTVRHEGDPLLAECEALVLGKAKDTGRIGPTWTLDGHYCTGAASGCEHSPYNPNQLWAITGGTYEVCAPTGDCGSLLVER